MKPVRVLLAEDHRLVRAGIRALLDGIDGVEVVGEASDGREAVALVKTLRPDVALLDVAMPELNGLDAAEQIVRRHSRTRVIILSMHASEEYVLKALRIGVLGYLLKDADIAELEVAIRAVARGEPYLTPAVSKHVVADYVQRTESGESPEPLTLRQREILQLVAEGRTTKEIAARLGISGKTVETHRTQLMDRLDIHDVAGLVRYAIRVGLVTSAK